MLNSLDLPTDPSRDARRRRHVGRRRFLRGRRAAEARGLRRRRRHAAALRPRRRDAPQGRLLRRPGHPRRPPRRRGARHPALCARLREPLPRGGDRALRRRATSRGETPIPCVALQPARSSSATCWRPPATSAPTRWRPATTSRRAPGRTGAARCTAPPIPTATRAISCSPPRREQLDFLRFPLGELPKDETRALARELGLAVADKPDSQDICFVPQGRYTDVIERLQPGRGARPARSSTSTAACSAATRASSTTPSASAAASASRSASRSTSSASTPAARAGDRRPARGAGHPHDPPRAT